MKGRVEDEWVYASTKWQLRCVRSISSHASQPIAVCACRGTTVFIATATHAPSRRAPALGSTPAAACTLGQARTAA